MKIKKKAGRPRAKEGSSRVSVPDSKLFIIKLIINNQFPCLKKLRDTVLNCLK